MRQLANLILAVGLMLIASLGCAHIGDPCDNKLVERIPSPDGSLVVSVYSRQCPSKLYTYVAVERPPKFMRSAGENYCHLVHWGGKHPVRAIWNSTRDLSISTPELSDLDMGGTPKDRCGDITVSYTIPGYPRPSAPRASDRPPPENIRLILDEAAPCINNFARKGDNSRDIVDRIRQMSDSGVGQQKLRLTLLIRFKKAAGCELSEEAESELKRLARMFDLEAELNRPTRETSDIVEMSEVN